MATGKTHTLAIRLPGTPTTATYSDAEGHGFLVDALGSGVGGLDTETLQQLSLSGRVQVTYPRLFGGVRFNGSAALSPNGSELAMGEWSDQIAEVSKTGAVERHMTVAGAAFCMPTRWWTATEFLASCQSTKANSSPLLWLVSTAGTPPKPFTLPGSSESDENAWQIGQNVSRARAECGWLRVPVPGQTHRRPHHDPCLCALGELQGQRVRFGCGQRRAAAASDLGRLRLGWVIALVLIPLPGRLMSYSVQGQTAEV